MSCKHLVGHGSEGVDVATSVFGLSGGHTRRHVCGSALRRGFLDIDHRIVEEGAHQAEVGDHGSAAIVQQYIGGLKVAVQEPPAMCVAQAIGHLSADGDDFVGWQSFGADQVVQAPVSHQGHGEEGTVARGRYFQYSQNIGMRQFVHVTCFGKEVLHNSRVLRQLTA